MKRMVTVFLAILLVLACSFASADEYIWHAAVPNGAPALSVATVAAEKPEQFTFITADTVAAEFTKAENDFIIAPVNAGAKLFKAGKSTYQLAAVVTWGNLYFASRREGFVTEDMAKYPVTLFGAETINASVALYALRQNGIEPVLADALAGAAETKAVLETDAEAIVLTAEPMLTAAKKTAENITAYAVNDLLKTASGMDGYTQAGLFVRAETLEKHPEEVKEVLSLISASCAKCTEAVDEVAAALTALEMTFPKPAIASCAIRYVAAADAREMLEKTVQIDPAQFGGDLPADEFYYAAE